MTRTAFRKTTVTIISGTCGKGHKGGGWSERLNSDNTAERRFRRASKAACRKALAALA